MASETHLVPLEFDDLSPYLEQINTEITKVLKELDKIKDRSSSEIPRESLETRVEHLNNTIMSMCSEKVANPLKSACKIVKEVKEKWKDIKKHMQENNLRVFELMKDVEKLKERVDVLQNELDKQRKSHQDELHDLKTSHQKLQQSHDELETQVKSLQESRQQLLTEINGNKNLLLRSEIVAELQRDLELNIHSDDRTARLEKLWLWKNDEYGATLINRVKESFANLILTDETELDCFTSTINYMKEERNNFAHVSRLVDGVPEKQKFTTLELKRHCHDTAERMVLKLLCQARGKPWTDSNDPARTENNDVFPLAP